MYTCNITDSGNTCQTDNFQFCFRLIHIWLSFSSSTHTLLHFPCLKVMLCSWALHNQAHSLKDYFVTWSIRFVCHYRLTTDKWKLTSCGFQVLTFLHGVGGGNVVTLHCVSPIPTQSVETDQKIFSSSSWSSVTWHQAELRGQVERTSVQGMTQVRSPSLSCCFIVAEAPPVGQPDLFTSSLQSDTFLPPDNSTQFTFWAAFDLRQFGNSENWRYWALKVIDQSNISVNYLHLS